MSQATILIVDNHVKTSMLYASSFEVYLAAKVIEIHDIDEANLYLQDFEPDIILASHCKSYLLKFMSEKLCSEAVILPT